MGCFNTIRMDCPKCGRCVKEQTKAGSCGLEVYRLEDAPIMDLAEICEEANKGRIACRHCGARLSVKLQTLVRVVEAEEQENEP